MGGGQCAGLHTFPYRGCRVDKRFGPVVRRIQCQTVNIGWVVVGILLRSLVEDSFEGTLVFTHIKSEATGKGGPSTKENKAGIIDWGA